MAGCGWVGWVVLFSKVTQFGLANDVDDYYDKKDDDDSRCPEFGTSSDVCISCGGGDPPGATH